MECNKKMQSFDADDMRRKIKETTDAILAFNPPSAKIGIIMGTGLGGLASEIECNQALSYGEIPHFPVSTVPGHEGKLLFGRLGTRSIVSLQGRFHLYEGYEPWEIAFPLRVLASLGIDTVITSNAAGGLNPVFEAGDLMVIRDHINLTGFNPLRGPNLDELGPRFPDMSEPYNRELINLAERLALEKGIRLHKGVFVGISGPSMETAAETRFLRNIGADAVGMSTIMEVITAVHLGLRVLGISVITNVNLPDNYKPAPLELVIATAEKAGPTLRELIKSLLQEMTG